MTHVDFTVLMAVYGGDDAYCFSKALNSVFSNSRLPNAVVLVVDGPVPLSIQQVIAQHRHCPGMLIVQQPSNRGLAEALNAGLAHIRTEWVVRADADDFNHPNRFETLCTAMDDSVDLLGSSIREVERDGQVICERRLPLHHNDLAKFMRRRNPFNHMSVAFRTELARQCGGYPVLHLREDYALWIRMYARGARMRNLPQNLVDATTGREMYERRGGWRYAKGEWTLQALLVTERVKSPVQAAIDLLLRSVIFLAPRSLRRVIYENLLRHRPAMQGHI
jgi:glycosyltransferase involved in cell wall biosynthesis